MSTGLIIALVLVIFVVLPLVAFGVFYWYGSTTLTCPAGLTLSGTTCYSPCPANSTTGSAANTCVYTTCPGGAPTNGMCPLTTATPSATSGTPAVATSCPSGYALAPNVGGGCYVFDPYVAYSSLASGATNYSATFTAPGVPAQTVIQEATSGFRGYAPVAAGRRRR